ncbi:MAG: adenylate/guanylate cyclase domain-containing protein [Spirochaetaceae bacterium]|nr:adenylate/guanylate cyclase domain-containing protein [Spirochaetaceae bacterium]
MKLEASYSFYWNELLSPGQGPSSEPFFLKGQWANNKTELPPSGYGTYQLIIEWNEIIEQQDIMLRVPSISSSYKLYIDGIDKGGLGVVGKTLRDSLAIVAPHTFFLKRTGNRTEILIQVSNYHDVSGGLWNPLVIGNPNLLLSQVKNIISRDLFLCGALLIIGLFFLIFGFNLLKFKSREYLLFGIFSIIMALRVLLVNQRILPALLLQIPWPFWGALEYWTVYVAVPLFALFIGEIFPRFINWRYKIILIVCLILGSLFTITVPIVYITKLISLLHLYIIIISIFIFLILGQALYFKESGAIFILIGFVIMTSTIVNDLIVSNTSMQGRHLTPWGTFFFFILLVLFLAGHFFKKQEMQTGLSKILQSTNNNLLRFVPLEILHYLGKSDLSQIEVGENVSKEMTVLFCNIKSFNKLSESMTSEDCFNFLNSYFNHMGPIIRKHGGFIDKFIGDSIMALFPDSPDEALSAAVEMQETMTDYNSGRKKAGYQHLKIGIGLNSGIVTVGTIGEKERMEGTAISDVVNLARRMESLTRIFDANMIISEEVFRRLDMLQSYTFCFLGRVQVLGKMENIGMYEIIDGCENNIFEKKRNLAPKFERALLYYHLKQFEDAEKIFLEILKDSPENKATLYYLKDCQKVLHQGLDEDWQGTLIMEVK